MNFALPAIVVFVILLPGFVARSRFKRVERTAIDHSPFGNVVTEGVILASVLHLFWIAGMYLLCDRTLAPENILPLFTASSEAQKVAIAAISAQFGEVSKYFLSLLMSSFLVPGLIREIVSRYRLDIHDNPLSRMLRFNGAPWYYLLSGADFSKDNEPDMVSVSAIVDVAGEAFLYAGILEDYFVDQEGGLDRLILSEVSRRPIAKDKIPEQQNNKEQRFYPIDGDYFVLRYSEAITMNVQYIKLEELEKGASVDPAHS